MRKNKSMRVAALLLALTLITSCFVGGTFAKYVTSGQGEDTARVAKFGVTVTAHGAAFSKIYKDTALEEDDSTATVVSSTEEKVVAPGTEGSMLAMGLQGSPEVDVTVTYAATVTLGGDWKDAAGNYYCPLVVTVNGTEIKGLEQTDAAAFKAAIESAINGYTKTYEANTNLAEQSAEDLTVAWSWPFSTSDANDIKDTYLGDQAAAGKASTIKLDVTTTVTQVD